MGENIYSKGNGLVSSDGKTTKAAASSSAGLIYPPEMRGDVERPCIMFTAHDRHFGGGVTQHHIWFPAPSGISMQDSASYGSVDIGASGAALMNTISGKGGLGGIASQIKSLNKEQLKSITAEAIPVPQKYKDVASLSSQQVSNPNTNTTFTSNGVRTHTMSFKMIARSADESELIRQIHSKFRYFTYASNGGDGNNITLAYPPVWTIKYMNMDSGVENKFIPRIYACYLTGVTTTMNEGGNIYFLDNAPLEVSIQLSFTETRALNRMDIEQMERDQLGDRGIDENGQPSVMQAPANPTPSPIKPIKPTAGKKGFFEGLLS